jgi:hypothetical protein
VDEIEQLANLFKALSDPTRLKLIHLLYENPGPGHGGEDSGDCPPPHACERHVLTGRTRKASSVYANSFNAIYPMVMSVRQKKEMGWKEEDSFDSTCPQAKMTWHLPCLRETA